MKKERKTIRAVIKVGLHSKVFQFCFQVVTMSVWILKNVLAHLQSAGLPLQKVRSRPQTGPTLMVLKWLRRMCCLCHDIHTWLDILVISDKDDQVSATFPASFLNYSGRDVKESTRTSRKEKEQANPVPWQVRPPFKPALKLNWASLSRYRK